jgi:Flagellar hook-associated protein
VSLDEETTNLIQYQHAYQANAKMISTIDELLDVVINGLKK